MISDLKPYPEYKESGLPWLGKVPAHWETIPNRGLMRKRKVLVGERHPDYRLLSLTKKGVVVRDISTGKGKFSSDMGTSQEVRCGDLIFCLFDVPETPRTVGLSRHLGMITGAYTVFECLGRGSPEYVELFYRAMDDRKLLSPLYSGLRNTIPAERFLGTKTPLPPPSEQAAIVRFLDWANGRLERAIRAKRKVIALLTEQKQAIIHRAVTRGLDPNVALKPSGIPWLGDIPAHWEVCRLKRVMWLQRGFDLPADIRKPGNVPVYSSGGHIDNHDVAMAAAPGVVIGRYGSTDAVFYVTEPYWPHNTSLFTTTVYGNNAKWCFYLLRSIAKGAYAGKSAVPGVDRKDLFDIAVPHPSVEEQTAIASDLDNALAGFELSISSVTQQIVLLREYRTRLVADIVTGKIDVREAAARLPDEAPLDVADADPELADDDELSDEEAVE